MDGWSTVTGIFALDLERLLSLDLLVRFGIQALLLVGSAFFSGSETALFSLSRVDLHHLRQRQHPQAERLHALMDEPRGLIVSILCGNELVNVAAVANMTGILVALYGEAKAGWVALLVMIPLLLLVGEVTPKTIAVSDPRRVSAELVARPLGMWVRVIAPVRWVVRLVSERITTWLVGPERSPEHILQVDEFRSLVEDFAESGKLRPASRILINNLLAAATTEIVTVMTPRSRTAFLDGSADLMDLIAQFKALRHWRVPVYRGHRDHLLGFLYAEDVLRLHLDGSDLAQLNLEEVLRPPIVVPLTKNVAEMFDFFLRNEARAAVVLNEFGGVAGFITVNDVLRFIFGPFATELEPETVVIRIAPDVYEAPGDTKLSDFNRVTNFGVNDVRMTTIGGVAFRHLDRLPQVGDEVFVEGFTITVLDMDEHRIAKVRVGRGSTEEIATAVSDSSSEEVAS